MTFLRVQKNSSLQIEGYGTSEGVKKSWESRKRKVGGVAETTGLFWKLKQGGGFTYHPIHRDSPKSGFVVAVYRGYEKQYNGFKIAASDISRYMKDHLLVFQRNPKAHIGGWLDSKSGKVFLDISVVTPSRKEAVTLGKQHKQLAVWDLGKSKEIRLAAAKSDLVRFDLPEGMKDPEEIANLIHAFVNKHAKGESSDA